MYMYNIMLYMFYFKRSKQLLQYIKIQKILYLFKKSYMVVWKPECMQISLHGNASQHFIFSFHSIFQIYRPLNLQKIVTIQLITCTILEIMWQQKLQIAKFCGCVILNISQCEFCNVHEGSLLVQVNNNYSLDNTTFKKKFSSLTLGDFQWYKQSLQQNTFSFCLEKDDNNIFSQHLLLSQCIGYRYEEIQL
eukprot:TRINITY_DN10219_c0_g1_i11.p1 TRINITY_DN10219_c0_g1~~TRINITY_DN10219_c0_g1_i11.p1  ORF type:complete len:192 (-),score=-6.47 TRINITY_DN10219_c0_g1_i11:865-1440(-)